MMQWVGLQHFSFEWHNATASDQGQDRWITFTADTSSWPNRVEWFNEHQSSVMVTQPTGKQFYFRLIWMETYPQDWPSYQHIDQLTVNFGAIPEMKEVMPETFLKFLERLGQDDGYLRIQHRMQQKVIKAQMKDLKRKGKNPRRALPPWDPRKIEILEQQRIELRTWMAEKQERGESRKEQFMERWGFEEIPPITPELLDQIEAASRKFLEECLSPGELEYFDEHGHLKIGSTEHSNIHYIVKVKDTERVQRFVNGEHVANICIHSKWSGLPILDTLAMKVLFIKHAEEDFLKAGNISMMRSDRNIIWR